MARRRDDDGKADLNLGLGGLFEGLGGLVDLVGNMVAEGESLKRRTGSFQVKNLGEEARGVFGVSVRLGLGGEPEVQRFGNLRTGEDGPVVADVREPLVDVFDEGARIVVAAELPGVAEDEIEVQVEGDILRLETRGARRYAREVLLPAAVEPASLTRSYRNGILELGMDKA